MARHVARNLKHADSSIAGTAYFSYLMVTLREIFLAGGWSEVYKTNTAEWDNNILLSLSDCQVSSGTPYRIYSATGGFSALAKGYGFTLIDGTNDENCRVMRIANVVDDNNIDVEPENAPPGGWTTATGLTGRAFNWGKTDPLTTGTILIMGAPSGTNEVQFDTSTNAYTLNVSCWPDGYQSGAGHQAGTPTIAVSASYSRVATLNAYFSDPNGIIYFFEDYYDYRPVIMFGELDDTEAGDTYPGFVVAGRYEDVFNATAGYPTYVYMIDSLVLTTIYGGRFCEMVNGYDRLADTTYRFNYNLDTRTVRGGKAILRKPWIYCGSVASAGFPRGRFPDIIRICNAYWESMRPIDPVAGNWFHLASGLCVPLAGTSDVLPRRIQ